MNLFSFIKTKPKQSLRLSDLSDRDKKELLSISSSNYDLDKKERKFIERRLGVKIEKFSDYNSFLSAGNEKVWATYRSMHIISNVVTCTDIYLEDEEGQMVEEDNDILNLLRNPNPYDTQSDLLTYFVYHTKLTGNAYWLKDEIDGSGKPQYLYPLLPQNMKPVAHSTDKFSSYEYQVNGETLEFKPEEIIHFKNIHPTDLHMGMGDIEPSQSIYEDYISRNNLNEAFLKNGASPSGILTSPENDFIDDDWEMLKTRWRSEYEGTNNTGKTAIMNGKWEYHKLGLTMQEMEAIEKEKWNIHQIFHNHGVPLSIAGIENAANYATARQDDINFRSMTCQPILRSLVNKLNCEMGLVPYDSGVRFSYKLTGLLNVEQVVKDFLPLVKVGAMTPNELRKQAGLPKVEDPYLDQFFIERNLMPIEMAGITAPSNADLQAISSATQT